MTLFKFKNEGNVAEKFPFIPAVFSDLFNDYMNETGTARDVLSYVPAVNIAERAEDFMIEVAAPGVDKEDFKISVENGVLSISAGEKEEQKEENLRFTRKEFSACSFKRSFTLPEHVEADQIAASHKNGVLTLLLPKKEEAKQKPVKEIKVS